MNLRSLHGPSEPTGAARWMVSAAAIVMAHLSLIAAAVAWYQASPPPGVTVPAILVDMAPASAAPETRPQDVAPGPQIQQAEAPAPRSQPVEPAAAMAQPVPSTPPQEKAEVELPPEQPTPLKPQPAPIVPDPPKVAPKERLKDQPKESPKERPKEKPKQVRAAAMRPSDRPPSPRTAAPPRAERQAALATAARSGAAAAAALPSYRDRLAAHLQRFKRYPAAAEAAGEQGVAMLSFTVGRGGQLLGSRLARSSGSAALDAETLAMVRRAQPLPSFPSEMMQASLSFTVPVRFSMRQER